MELKMLELSRFFGMVIYLQFKDIQHHNKPHVHVYYGDYSASVGIDGILLLTFSTGEQKLFDTTV